MKFTSKMAPVTGSFTENETMARAIITDILKLHPREEDVLQQYDTDRVMAGRYPSCPVILYSLCRKHVNMIRRIGWNNYRRIVSNGFRTIGEMYATP
ncbi:MAG: hypothetical protein KDK41_15265 [Leptospiraceae bacterium]|nr:hypothetical protein [Leptospiraceae bacterium]